jgi:mannan endo-1,4-beta-mannosidase
MGTWRTRALPMLALVIVLATGTQCRPRPGTPTTTRATVVTTPSTAQPTTTAGPTTTPTTARPTTTVTSPPSSGGFSVRDGRLYDARGAEFVLRGINHPHAWYTQHTSSFAAMKAAGANSVRVVLSGGRWPANSAADVSNVISLCKQNKLICVLENHDTTGYGEQGGATTLSAAADYFVGLASVLRGQEAYVIVNIGNEPFGNNVDNSAWARDTSAAIRKIRAAGLRHTLMVDAPNWGQDWQNTMRENAPSVWAVDQNIMFSVHMYGVYDTAAEVRAYLDSFTSRRLPIVVGEFGNRHSDGDPDEDTIMAYTTTQRIGYMGWSWSGNGGGVEYLDMVNGFNPSSLTAWGERFINGANGLRQTSRPATVY